MDSKKAGSEFQSKNYELKNNDYWALVIKSDNNEKLKRTSIFTNLFTEDMVSKNTSNESNNGKLSLLVLINRDQFNREGDIFDEQNSTKIQHMRFYTGIKVKQIKNALQINNIKYYELNLSILKELKIISGWTKNQLSELISEVLENSWNDLVSRGKVPADNIRKAIGSFYHLGLCNNLRFLRIPNSGWIAKSKWPGDNIIHKYIRREKDNKYNARVYTMFAQILGGNISNRPYYLSLTLKDEPNVPKELINRKIIIRNKNTIDEKGFTNPVYNVGLIQSFEKIFF